MFALVEQYRSSGQSVKTFSQSQGIKASTFSYWVQKKRKAEETQATGNFIPINLPSTGGSGGVEMIFPNGIQVRLSHFDKRQIEQLIKIY